MPLTTTKEILLDAQKGGYAVGAFNFENMEMAAAIVAAAEKMGRPVILQTTLSTTGYGTIPMMAQIGRTAAASVHVPVAVHLDHGSKFDALMQALHYGYTSLMIDGSQLAFADNIAISRKVVEVAKPMGIPVEAELGKVGGREDDVVAESGGYTDPAEAAEFAQRTGADSLAVGVGTAHGVYKGTPKLALDVLEAIRRVVEIPLVLHGASGLSDADVQACIRLGVCKVNFATELRQAYTCGAREALLDESVYDPKVYGRAGKAKVTELVCNRIKVCSMG